MFFLVKAYNPRQAQIRKNRPFEEVELEVKKKHKGSIPLGRNIRLKGFVLYALIGIGVLSVLAMASTYQANLTVKDLNIEIYAGADQEFLDKKMVGSILTQDGDMELMGKKMDDIQLEDLENLLLADPNIHSAEVYKTIQGALNVEVVLRKPMARLINNSGDYLYIDAEGKKFPGSTLGSANVVLVRGDFNETLADSFSCSTIQSTIPVLNFIHNDEFWNAQISEIMITQSGELLLSTQVGSMRIDFGYPDRMENKLQNLKDFYRQVIPEVGWDHYRSVNLKIRGQVIAK